MMTIQQKDFFEGHDPSSSYPTLKAVVEKLDVEYSVHGNFQSCSEHDILARAMCTLNMNQQLTWIVFLHPFCEQFPMALRVICGETEFFVVCSCKGCEHCGDTKTTVKFSEAVP